MREIIRKRFSKYHKINCIRKLISSTKRKILKSLLKESNKTINLKLIVKLKIIMRIHFKNHRIIRGSVVSKNFLEFGNVLKIKQNTSMVMTN